MVILEWADATKNEMVNGKIAVQAPWNDTSYKLLYFNCKDSNGNILDVDVYDNFIDESYTFTESDIDKNREPNLFKGTHTLRLETTLGSDSTVSVGEYKIGVEYHTYKQISAIIKISGTAVSKVRYWSYNVGLAAYHGYILSTAMRIYVSGTDIPKQIPTHNGTEWLLVRYTPSSDIPYTFINEVVYNENGLSYTNISNEPTSERNLQWGSRLYVLAYSKDANVFDVIDNTFLFADSWSALSTEQTL